MDVIPATMTAIAIDEPGGPDVLKPVERPVPHPFEGEILIAVEAAGVNRPDILQRMGGYPPPKGASDLPGLEVAGHVAAIGRNVMRYKVGDAVMALVAGGGYAEYVAVHETNALPVPEGLSMIEAAAIPETFFTVWSNVFERGGLKAGETLLVHGGTSGIGTVAIQLAKAFGARVITTVGSAEKCAACLSLGADRAINYQKEDFVVETKAATDGHGADVILDMVGGDYIERNYEAAAPDGRIVQIAFLNGSSAEVDFRRLMMKRLTHTGSTLRPRPVAFKAGIARALEEHVWPLLAARRVLPQIDQTFPLRDAAGAHRRMESSAHIGKIVLTVGSGTKG
ncbi:NAD(P)H-quinone oxidoreductase [Kaistia dalseonensis]|uniref:NADPH2:quinone reductase n=1 Tax=Kaistia dalseonensis TaxID=410840 RepID=A0ABU0HA50_9HYPH|nr:NAD(P)H-quinone oxidoreductase [Kaistia dalseonensis]MCX5496570.1 NAD(P)H-quinone oxidoreductase [Kaistia dalseonensis]MDQ0439192.1 NADPH2:quinone reductase [Kaistia dalseonensis]